jgi:predicted site-specific integrase-resolvase
MTTNDVKLRHGLKGISELLGCSISTAQRIKKKGIIDEAIIQIGKTIVIDERKALELLKKHSKV